MESKRPEQTQELPFELPLELQYKVLEFLGTSAFDIGELKVVEKKEDKESKEIKEVKTPPDDPTFKPFFNRVAGQALRSIRARRLAFLKDVQAFNTGDVLFPKEESG